MSEKRLACSLGALGFGAAAVVLVVNSEWWAAALMGLFVVGYLIGWVMAG